VHLVNSEYDAGPIVLQQSVAIGDLNSAEEIAERVLEIEHRIYARAVKLMVEGRLCIQGRRIQITGDE
jgi:phosphoribosylglycinamide formyltransferase-1